MFKKKRVLSFVTTLSMLFMVTVGGFSATAKMKARDTVTINYATFRTDDDAIMTKLIEKFQKENPSIIINRVSTKDAGAYYQTLKANIASDTDVDVFDIHPSQDFVQFAKDGILADLSGLSFNKTYLPSAKTLSSVNGKNYGFLTSVNMILCFYNKAIFKEAGVKVPMNFNDLVNVVNKLKAKKYGGIAYCGADVAGVWLGNAMVTEEMGPASYARMYSSIDSGATTSLKSNTAYYTAIKTLARINKTKILYDNSSTTKYDQALSLFASKKAPIMMMGTWTFGTSDKDFPGIDYGIFPFPTLDKANTAYAEPGQVTVAYAKSKNLDASKKFINFLGSVENSNIYISNAKSTPTVKGVKATFKGSEMLSAAMEKGVNILPVLSAVNSDTWTAPYLQVYTNVLFKSGDADKEIAAFEKLLVKANLKNKK